MELFNAGHLKASFDKFELVLKAVPVKTKVRRGAGEGPGRGRGRGQPVPGAEGARLAFECRTLDEIQWASLALPSRGLQDMSVQRTAATAGSPRSQGGLSAIGDPSTGGA